MYAPYLWLDDLLIKDCRAKPTSVEVIFATTLQASVVG